VILQAFAVDHVAMMLLVDGVLVVRAQEGKLTPRIPTGSGIPRETGLSARAIALGKPVAEHDVSVASDYVPGYEETRSEMCLPLISQGETLGVMALESARPKAFNSADAQPLESVADICAAAIQNARYFERIKHLAYVDGLTGISNRRLFEKVIAEEIERAQRYGNELAVIMIDVDNFKKLNDEFGHLLGDEALRQMSTIFAQNMRRSDVACRYGGEEFVILAPQTSAPHAQVMAEKLRKAVEGFAFSGVPRKVTITAGIASYPANGRTRDELVKAADDALYQAKQAGRNRVHLAGSGMATSA